MPKPRILRFTSSRTRYKSINKHSVSPKDTLRHHSHFANYMKAHNQKHDYVNSKCLSLTNTHSNLVRIIGSSTQLYESLIKVNSSLRHVSTSLMCVGWGSYNFRVTCCIGEYYEWLAMNSGLCNSRPPLIRRCTVVKVGQEADNNIYHWRISETKKQSFK